MGSDIFRIHRRIRIPIQITDIYRALPKSHLDLDHFLNHKWSRISLKITGATGSLSESQIYYTDPYQNPIWTWILSKSLIEPETSENHRRVRTHIKIKDVYRTWYRSPTINNIFVRIPCSTHSPPYSCCSCYSHYATRCSHSSSRHSPRTSSQCPSRWRSSSHPPSLGRTRIKWKQEYFYWKYKERALKVMSESNNHKYLKVHHS